MKNSMSERAQEDTASSRSVEVVCTRAMLNKLFPLFADSLCALRYEMRIWDFKVQL
jgi:hypothetical protein